MPKSIWEMEFKDLVSANLTKIESGISRTFSKIDALDHGLKNMMGTTEHAMHEHESMVGGLLKAGVELFAVEKVIDWGKEVFNAGLNMESLRIQMDTLTGSTQLGGEAFESLSGLYQKFPILGKDNLMQAGEQLLEVGMPVERLAGTLKQIGDISGGNGAKMMAMTESYKRAVSFGSVQSRMLMQQPVLMKEIERMYGLTGIAAKKFAAEGDISLTVLDKAMTNLTSKGGAFYNMLDNRMESTGGKWAQLKMKAEEYGEQAFNKMQPYINSVIDLAGKYFPMLIDELGDLWSAATNSQVLIDAFNGLKWAAGTAFDVIRDVYGFLKEHEFLFYSIAGGVVAYKVALISAEGATAFIPLLKNVLIGFEMATFAVANATSTWAAVTWLLDAAWAACPLVWIVAGIGLVVGAIVYAVYHFDKLKAVFNGIWEAAKTVFSNIVDFFAKIFQPVLDIITDLSEGRFVDAAEAAGKALFNAVTMPFQAGVAIATGDITKGVGNAYANGSGHGVDAGETDAFDGKAKAGSSPKIEGKEGYHPDTPGAGGDTSLSGESKIRNVIVHINGGLVHTINLHAANLKEGMGQVKEHVARVLVDTVRDAELALGPQGSD